MRAAEIKIVKARRAADETNLGHVGASTAIRTTGHANGYLCITQSTGLEFCFQTGDQRRQIALTFSQRETAGRQCHTGDGVTPQTAGLLIQRVFTQQCGDFIPLR